MDITGIQNINYTHFEDANDVNSNYQSGIDDQYFFNFHYIGTLA